jgi:predicted Zn-dependent protease
MNWPMKPRRFERGRTVLSFAGAAVLCLAWVGCARTPPAAQGNNENPPAAQGSNQTPPAGQGNDQNPSGAKGDNQDEELQLGEEVFNELKAKGEIVESSPLYDQLRPIADTITRAAQPQYNHPLKFYLVHEAQPNAFATPGGNVYVTDSLMYFVKNIDQLAGTLCHEVSHTIHHDTVTLMKKREKLREREVGAAVLLGPTRAHLLAIAFLGKLHSLGYSRDVEERADLTGSDICAVTSYNPWGVVWLLQDFKTAKIGEAPELLSDHPNGQHRVAALEQHFRKDPSVFGKFNPDPKSATPISVPANAEEVFLR